MNRPGRLTGRRRVLLAVWVAAVVLVTIGAPRADTAVFRPGTAPTPLGQEGGSDSPALTLSGATAYVGIGTRLAVIDVSNPSAPRLLGQSPVLPARVQDVVVSGSLAYVVTGDSGLQILDLTNVQHIYQRASLDTLGFAKALHVANGMAYVADFGAGVTLVDVFNPDAPTLRGHYPTRGGPHAVDVVGAWVYVADDGSGLLIIDASNPANPVLRGAIQSAGVAFDVQVVGTVAYLAYYNHGLRTIDVSNPAAPRRLGHIDTPGLAQTVHVVGSTAFVADGDRLLALDVSNPALPFVAAAARTTAVDVAATDTRVLVTDRRQLNVYETDAAGALLRRASYPFVGTAQAVAISGALGYVASRSDGLSIFDLGDPAHPQRLSVLPTTGPLLDVASAGSRVIAVGPRGLHVVDVSQTSAPVLRGSVALPGSARGVAVAGNLAVVTAAWGGVHLVDISNPQAPVRRATYAHETAEGVAVAGSLAFVAAGKTLLILDVANPAAPTLRSTMSLPGWGVDAAVQGSYVYIAAAEAGLLIVDVTNPAVPVLRGTLPTTNAVGVTVSGPAASVADNHGGVIVADVTNPAQPVRTTAFDTPGLARGVASLGPLLVVADDYGGLAVWSPDGGAPPMPTSTSTPTPTMTPVPSATPTPTATPAPLRWYFPYVVR